VTETLIFIAILGVLLLQLLGRFLERMRVSEAVPEQRSADEELDRQPSPDRSSETPVLAKPYPPGLPQLTAQQPVVSQRPRAQSLQGPSTEVGKQLRREVSLRAGFVPRDRADLRRAIVLMELLGQPRGLDRPGKHRNH